MQFRIWSCQGSVQLRLLPGGGAEETTSQMDGTRSSVARKVHHGIRCLASPCTQLLVTLNEISLLSDAKMQVDVVYIDFAKAFDSISHQKL